MYTFIESIWLSATENSGPPAHAMLLAVIVAVVSMWVEFWKRSTPWIKVDQSLTVFVTPLRRVRFLTMVGTTSVSPDAPPSRTRNWNSLFSPGFVLISDEIVAGTGNAPMTISELKLWVLTIVWAPS